MKKIKIQEQEDVLNSNGNVVVSASAGSGKTSVMVEKVIKYVMAGLSVKNILALTFTNLAANEMKVRLEKVLGEKIETEGRVELADEIDWLPQADISTFHSFYEKIVKKYFYVLGISPDFEIISTEELLALKEKAFLNAVEEFKKENYENYLNLSDALGKKRSDNSIKERIFKLDQFLSSQFGPEDWIENVSCVMYENIDETFSSFFSETFAKVLQTRKKLEIVLAKAKDLGEDGLCKHINSCISALIELNVSDFQFVFKHLKNNFKFDILKKKAGVIEETDCFFDVKKIKEDFMNYVKAFRKKEYGSFDDVLKSFNNCKIYIKLLISLYNKYKTNLDLKKKELNSFDFSDLENLCFQILKDENIRQEIKQRYVQIFVDEFQDINPMQFEILKLISNNNVLFVGDAKQSIYAFRQADVDIFVETCKNFEKDENSKSLSLKSNFRSNPKILNFANEVFNILMTETTSGIDYESTSQFQPVSQNSCQGDSVVVLGIVEPEDAPEKEPDKIATAIGRERVFKEISLEAKVVAGEVSNLINQKVVVNGVEKEVDFGDIAILLRNRSALLGELASVFKSYNIPFIVNDEFNLLDSKEVLQVVSLLNLCVNFKDDINLTPMLASYFGKLTYNELAEIKLEQEADFFWEKVESYLKNNSNSISQKLNNFIKLTETLAFNIEIFGVKNALYKMINETGYFEHVLSLYSGKEKLERLNQFLNHIEESGQNNNLEELVVYLNSAKQIKIPSLKKCSNNSVTITTIHASKGLEFPVVILADCGKDFLKTKPEKEDLKIDKTLGLAIKNYDSENRKVYDSIFEKILEDKAKRKEIAENLRLLYVALTRAKNKLIITGKVGKDFEEINKETDFLTIKSNYLNYIFGALQNKKIDGVKVDVLSNIRFSAKVENKNENVNIIPILKAKEKIEYEYYNENNVNLALKTSVSQIAQDGGQESVVETINNFSIYENQEFSSAQQGDLFHLIMEKIDFKSKSIKEDLKKLIDEKNFNIIENTKLFDLALKNINLLNELLPEKNLTLKEKEFMLYESLFNIFGTGTKEKLLIQGKLDLISVGEKNILIDYKYTGIKNEENLISKYKKQLIAYSYAAEKAIGKQIDEIYILSLKYAKLIKIK